MSDDEYFSKREYISNSKLSLLNPDEGGSFEKFNKPFLEEYSESFALGSAIHAYLLQPDEYVISELRKPTGKLGLFAERVFELRQLGLPLREAIFEGSKLADYYAEKLTGNRLKTAIRQSLSFYLGRLHTQVELGKKYIFLSSTLGEKFTKIIANIHTPHSDVLKLLNPTGVLSPVEVYNEYALFCNLNYIDEETGEISLYKFKAKFDHVSVDHDLKVITLVDLKTSRKPASYFMGNFVKSKDSLEEVWYNGSFQTYHYYRQLGIYAWLVKLYFHTLGLTDYSLKVKIVVLETDGKFEHKIYSLNSQQLKFGLQEFKTLLTLLTNEYSKS